MRNPFSHAPSSPNNHPDVQKTWTAKVDAWIALANMPDAIHQTSAEQAEAREAKERLDAASRTHLVTVMDVSGKFEPTPYDLGISEDPETTWAQLREAEAGQ